jgi:hypothetical protein
MTYSTVCENAVQHIYICRYTATMHPLSMHANKLRSARPGRGNKIAKTKQKKSLNFDFDR